MQITEAEVFVTCPGRNFVTLRIRTSEGLYGLGDATLNGREKAVVSYLEKHVIPCLIGRDPSKIEDTWQYLYRGGYWKGGSVAMTAVAAVDMALWDIKGKALETPVYDLLGGASRAGVMVYGHASGEDLEAAVDQVGRYLDRGYEAVRVQSGIPGLEATYGVADEDLFYEPAAEGLPKESKWSTRKYLNFVPDLIRRVRNVYGNDFHLLHDVHHRLTPIEAARLGKELEPYHLFWLEDPVSEELQEGFRRIREHTTTPLAVGEVFSSVYDAHQLITDQLIDYLRTSILRGGGITHMKRIAALCDLYHVKTGFHGATDLSPITMAAALHFGLWVHNFGIQEYMPHTEATQEVFPHAYTFEDGYMHPGDQPGLGVDFDEELAAEYPYERAYLPVSRREDGTMHNW